MFFFISTVGVWKRLLKVAYSEVGLFDWNDSGKCREEQCFCFIGMSSSEYELISIIGCKRETAKALKSRQSFLRHVAYRSKYVIMKYVAVMADWFFQPSSCEFAHAERNHLELASAVCCRFARTVDSYIAFSGDSFGRLRNPESGGLPIRRFSVLVFGSLLLVQMVGVRYW